MPGRGIVGHRAALVIADLQVFDIGGLSRKPALLIGMNYLRQFAKVSIDYRIKELIAHERGERPAWIKLPFLASVVFEQVYYDTLRALVTFAQEYLSLSPALSPRATAANPVRFLSSLARASARS
jgi:hypothetical protein